MSATVFSVFCMTRPGIEPWSPGPLANTLLIKPMAWYCTNLKKKLTMMSHLCLVTSIMRILEIYSLIYIYIYIYVCVCVCVCVWHEIDTLCLPILSLIRSSLRMSRLTFEWIEFRKAPYFRLQLEPSSGKQMVKWKTQAYGSFLNSFHLKIKRLTRRFDQR